jgi:RNA polymerase sigma-70 factor (ECF subfamily)
MRHAQAGDRAAYAELLMLLTAVAARYTRRRAGAVAWVDDVVQETLMTVHRARHTYDPTRPFAPWFYAIVSTRFIDVVRRERRIAGREIATDVLPEDAADTIGRSALDVDQIRAAVRALPDRQRAVIEGLKFRDESVRETATRLGMSEGAVKITAHRGYKTLRRLLGGGDRED